MSSDGSSGIPQLGSKNSSSVQNRSTELCERPTGRRDSELSNLVSIYLINVGRLHASSCLRMEVQTFGGAVCVCGFKRMVEQWRCLHPRLPSFTSFRSCCFLFLLWLKGSAKLWSDMALSEAEGWLSRSILPPHVTLRLGI